MPDAFFTELGIDKERIRSAVAARDASDAAYLHAGLAFANERAPALWDFATHAPERSVAKANAPAMTLDTTHAFVEASIGGRWVDFDPSLVRLKPSAQLGAGPVETASTLAASRFHVVRARFVLVYGAGARREESTALDRTIRTSDVGGVPIALGIGSPTATSLETISSAQSFFPFVDIGDKTTTGASFALRDANGRPLTSVRLVLETAGPGVAAKSHTRVLWDAASATEPAIALVRTYDMLVVPGPYGDSFSAAMLVSTVAHMKALWLYGATPPAQRVLPAVRDLEPAYPLALLDYVNRDLRIADALQAETPAVRFAFDRPDVVMLANGFERAGNAVRGITSFDIVDNGLHALADDPQAARLANVKRGMLDTYVEQHVLGFMRTPIVGAPQAFAEAKRSGVDPVFVDGGAPLPADVPARSLEPLRETVAQGEIAIALRAPVSLAGTAHYAWWAIDPLSGNTVGRMDDGSGGDMVEESFLLYWAKRVGMAYTLLGIVINGPQSVEDAEIGVFLGGANVIGEVLGALKSAYELSGGSYGSSGSGSSSGGADGGAPPASGGSPPSWQP